MGIVHIDKLGFDSVLAEELRDINGRLLLAKGRKIQQKHIRILKLWGITEVDIIGEAETEEPLKQTEERQRVREVTEATREVFRHADLDHPAMAELFRLSVKYRIRHDTADSLKKRVRIGKGENFDHPVNMNICNQIDDNRMKLPEIPAIVFELNEAISDPNSSAANVAEVVSKSPSLAARLLQIANSSFYGFPSRIDSISRAVTIIGNREISSLALGVSALTIFKDISGDIIDMHDFLRHSFACGIISRIFAAQINIPQTEQLFVSGLLHDIGRLVIYRYFPDLARILWKRSVSSGKTLHDEEIKILGCRHTDIGKILMKKWKLPSALENNVSHHHHPSKAPNSRHATIVHLADIIVNAMGIGTSGERFVHRLDEKAWEDAGISPNNFDMVIKQATHQLFTLEKILKD